MDDQYSMLQDQWGGGDSTLAYNDYSFAPSVDYGTDWATAAGDWFGKVMQGAQLYTGFQLQKLQMQAVSPEGREYTEGQALNGVPVRVGSSGGVVSPLILLGLAALVMFALKD